MSEVVSVQWFPGHMAKTRKLMEVNLRLVDLVVELTDARIPASSRNPEVDRIIGEKPRILVMNKADSADEATTQKWLGWYREQGIVAIATDCRSGKGLNKLVAVVREVLAEKIARWAAQGMAGRTIRLMIVGVPNVGKSSLVNKILGEVRVIVSDVAGTTRDAVDSYFENAKGKYILIDTAGLRKKSKVDDRIEKFSVLRATMAIERADV
ncbi:MAG: GTPase, partial [Angelakisella sp.]